MHFVGLWFAILPLLVASCGGEGSCVGQCGPPTSETATAARVCRTDSFGVPECPLPSSKRDAAIGSSCSCSDGTSGTVSLPRQTSDRCMLDSGDSCTLDHYKVVGTVCYCAIDGSSETGEIVPL